MILCRETQSLEVTLKKSVRLMACTMKLCKIKISDLSLQTTLTLME